MGIDYLIYLTRGSLPQTRGIELFASYNLISSSQRLSNACQVHPWSPGREICAILSISIYKNMVIQLSIMNREAGIHLISGLKQLHNFPCRTCSCSILVIKQGSVAAYFKISCVNSCLVQSMQGRVRWFEGSALSMAEAVLREELFAVCVYITMQQAAKSWGVFLPWLKP